MEGADVQFVVEDCPELWGVLIHEILAKCTILRAKLRGVLIHEVCLYMEIYSTLRTIKRLNNHS